MKREKLEQFIQKHGLKPERKVTTRDGEIYIAEGFVPPSEVPKNLKQDHPFGYWQGIYVISRGEEYMDYFPVLTFDAFHDSEKNWLPDQKKNARLNALEKEGAALQRKLARRRENA